MKLLALIGLLFVVIDVSLTLPASSIDPRWGLIADGDGRMHLVDARQLEPEPFFNAEVDTAFLLFTRSNPTVGQRITWNAASIDDSNFNRAHPTRFLIHGFNSGPSSGVNIAPTAAYLQRGDFNVIVVDWSIGAGTINYVAARNRVPDVSIQLARQINFMNNDGYASTDSVNIAGHSLGAHIAGIAGKLLDGRIQTIFGLDPAGLLFSINSPLERFHEGDAQYTEGIRTNAGNLGFDVPLGQSDFYPNWGSSQPGCGIDIAGSCAHSRAHQFFAESIINPGFVGRSCLSYQEITSRSCTGTETAIMGGEPGNIGTRGLFFVQTNSNSPFAMG